MSLIWKARECRAFADESVHRGVLVYIRKRTSAKIDRDGKEGQTFSDGGDVFLCLGAAGSRTTELNCSQWEEKRGMGGEKQTNKNKQKAGLRFIIPGIRIIRRGGSSSNE